MRTPPLKPAELDLVRSVFRHHSAVKSGTLSGARNNGTRSDCTDVDPVIAGDVEPLRAEAIASEWAELPLPYRMDVQPLAPIPHRSLLDPIDRLGIVVYKALC